MSAAGTGSGTSLQLPDQAVQLVVFERPAELVDVAERIYRQIFGIGLWLAAAFTALAVPSSLLQPSGSAVRGVLVCSACLVAISVTAMHPAALYKRLRRQPWLLLVPGALLGLGVVIVGRYSFQLFVPFVTIIGVMGIATPLRVVAAAGLLIAAGMTVVPLMDQDANMAGAAVVTVPPIVFWLIVERIAGFALRLHQSLSAVEPSGGATPRETWDGDAPAQNTTPGDDPPDGALPLALPEPAGARAAVEVDGVRLTARQLEVVLLACEGLRHAEIALCLGIGVTQVRRHLDNARKRTGSSSTPQLVAWARRNGLVPPPDIDSA